MGVNKHPPVFGSHKSSVHTLLSLHKQGRGELLTLTEGTGVNDLVADLDKDEVCDRESDTNGDTVSGNSPNGLEVAEGAVTGDGEGTELGSGERAREFENELVGVLSLLRVGVALNDLVGVLVIETVELFEGASEGSITRVSECEIVSEGDTDLTGVRDLLSENEIELEGESDLVGVRLGVSLKCDFDGENDFVEEKEIEDSGVKDGKMVRDLVTETDLVGVRETLNDLVGVGVEV